MNRNELLRRYLVFMVALFLIALGVSVITLAYLGTSPISSIPFVLSLNSSLSMGAYIFVLNIFLIVGQMVMLGRSGIRQKRIDLLMQIPVSVLFAFFIDCTMFLLAGIVTSVYVLQILSLVVGCAILALGICLEVAADVTMVSGEYFVQIASKYFKKEFGVVKIIFDVSLVVIAALFSLLLSRHIEGLREGTVLVAFLTGPFVKLFSPLFGFVRRWESGTIKPQQPHSTQLQSDALNPVVITISREYGSGGRLIGKRIADDLGIRFYDKDLIKLVAQESGMSEDFVSKNEQQMSNSLLYQMIMQDYEAPIEKSLSVEDALFVAQSRVIRQLANAESCVIVGRCADYILGNTNRNIHVFMHADMAHKVQRAVGEYGLDPATAANEVERINRARETHYHHYTGKRWGEMRNYHFTCDSGVVGEDQICDMIESIYRNKAAQ